MVVTVITVHQVVMKTVITLHKKIPRMVTPVHSLGTEDRVTTVGRVALEGHI